jgi:hypothetical protein
MTITIIITATAMVEIAILLGENLKFFLCERFFIFEDFFLANARSFKRVRNVITLHFEVRRISGGNRFIMMQGNS